MTSENMLIGWDILNLDQESRDVRCSDVKIWSKGNVNAYYPLHI